MESFAKHATRIVNNKTRFERKKRFFQLTEDTKLNILTTAILKHSVKQIESSSITTPQLHSTKPELRFCAGSNPARNVSEIRDGEDLK